MNTTRYPEKKVKYLLISITEKHLQNCIVTQTNRRRAGITDMISKSFYRREFFHLKSLRKVILAADSDRLI
jgi:hypothetical protein